MLTLIDVQIDSKLGHFENFESMRVWVQDNRIIPGRYCVISVADFQVQEVFFVDVVEQVGEDKITFDGIPFEQFAMSSQVKGSVRIDNLMFGTLTIWRKWQLIQLFESLKPGVQVHFRLGDGNKLFEVKYCPGEKNLVLYRSSNSY